MKKVFIYTLIFTILAASLPVDAIAQEASNAAEQTSEQNTDDLPQLEELPLPTGISADSLQQSTLQLLQEVARPSHSSAAIKLPVSVKVTKENFRADEAVSVIVANVQPSSITETVLVNSVGQTVEADIREVYGTDVTTLEILPGTHIKPGKYTLEVTADGKTTEQDFTWGVLAVNTNKSIYTPHETAKLSLAVLDAKGMMVCDAKLELRITNQELGIDDTLSTENGEIKVNPECVVKGFTTEPDYEAAYTIGAASGTYSMLLTAKTTEGEYSIRDTFDVYEHVAFDVERSTATRIYPPEVYPMTMTITAQQDFEGTVSDVVPDVFTVLQASSGAQFEEVKVISSEVAKKDVLGVTTSALGLPFAGYSPVSLGFGHELEDPNLKKLYAQFQLSGHDGADFSMPIGTPILAVDDGEVILAAVEGDYGTTIVLQHTWGKSYYGHLSELQVKIGQKVSKADQIGLSGNSGLSTGSHLHFGIKPEDHDLRNGYYGKIDPLPYLGLTEQSSKLSSAKVIRWHVSLKKGETKTLQYQYKAPNISPQFYTLGPLKFFDSDNDLVFQESRQWMIAADEVISATIISPRNSTLNMGTEQVGGTNAHVLTITNADPHPSFKWQFLTNGLRLLKDKKDGAGFLPVISQIQTAPEYMKQQGSPGSFVWKPYGLNANTTGSNVQQGFDRQNQPDGSIKMVRTYATTEEGIAEVLTETWTIPPLTDGQGSKSIKVTYSMTKNRGIVVINGVNEGTWRLKWLLSGIAEITSNNTNILTAAGTPIPNKYYPTSIFLIDVFDFVNSVSATDFTYSEVATNNKAEILFFNNGTTGNRLIDPQVTVDATLDNTNPAKFNNTSSNTVFISDQTGYVFFPDGTSTTTSRCVYRKTTNAGANWNDPVNVDDATGTDCIRVVVWYDRWTPGDTTGNTIHIISSEHGADDLWYAALNTTNDNLSTPTAISTDKANSLVSSGISSFLALTKGTDGDLYAGVHDSGAADSDTSWVKKCSATCTTGTNWSDISSGLGLREHTGTSNTDANDDELLLMPLASGNILAIRFDTGANTLDSKVFTDSGSTWDGSWASIDASVIDPTLYDGALGATLDKDDNKIYLAYAADFDNTTEDDDIRTAVYSGGSWTAKAAVQTNGPILTGVKIAYDENTNDVYTVYDRRAAGGSGSTLQVYWKKSTDGMTSWGDESSAVSGSGDDVYGLNVNIMSDERLYVNWVELNGASDNTLEGDTFANLTPSSGPTLGQLMRHGKWFNSSGAEQPFTF